MATFDNATGLRRRHAPRHARARRRRRGQLALLAVLAVVAPLIAVSGRTQEATAAAGSVRPGLGVWIAGHTDFVGYYIATVGGQTVKVYCVSPSRRAPTRIGLTTVARLGGSSTTVTRRLAQTLSAHGNAATAGQAEAVSQALNYEIGNRADVARRARYLSPAVHALARRYVAEASRARGPYTLSLHLPTAPLPGQSGRGTVTLRGPGGGRSATVRLASSANVATPATLRTDRAGHGSFSYRSTGGGAAHIDASVRGLPPITVRTSSGTPDRQRMLTWSPPVATHATARYSARAPGFSDRYECSSVCDGHPSVTVTACTPGGTVPSRISYRYGALTHRVYFPARTERQCRTWTTVMADGMPVSASWQFHTVRGWTAPVPAAGSFTVDCPAVPPVALALGLDCRTASLIAGLGRQVQGRITPVRNVTRHPMVLVLEGAVTGRFPVAPGATATTHSFALACGSAGTVTVRAGIARADGAYNYGPRTMVVLP